jgi:hypothetical protein
MIAQLHWMTYWHWPTSLNNLLTWLTNLIELLTDMIGQLNWMTYWHDWPTSLNDLLTWLADLIEWLAQLNVWFESGWLTDLIERLMFDLTDSFTTKSAQAISPVKFTVTVELTHLPWWWRQFPKCWVVIANCHGWSPEKTSLHPVAWKVQISASRCWMICAYLLIKRTTDWPD